MAFGNQPGQVRFTDITESSGILRQGQSWGLSIFDINDDGLPDINQNNHQQKPVSEFLNQGDGTFIDVATEFFARRFPGDFHGVVGFDFDNDGDRDIFWGGGGDLRASDENPNKSNRFLVQENGRFTERAEELGIRFPLGRSRQPNIFDFDGNGLLDVLFTSPKRPDLKSFATIFLQDDDGKKFTNLGLESGLDIETGNGTFGIFADVTGDARHELIYVARNPKIQIYDTSELPLREISADILPPDLLSGVNVIKDIAVADFNGDTHQDLYVIQQGTGNSGYRLDQPNVGRAHLEAKRETLGLTFREAGKLFLNFDSDPDLKLPTFFRQDVTVRRESIYIGAERRNPKSLNFRLNPDKASSQGMPAILPNESGVFIGYDNRRKLWDLKVVSRGKKAFNFLFETERLNPRIETVGFKINNNAKPDLLLTYDPDLGRFVDTTSFARLDRQNIASRSVVAEDFDNDGDRDIFIVATANTQNQPDVLFENNGKGQFRRVPGAAGAAGILEGIGDSVGVADFDINGFLDITLNNGDVLGPDRNFWLDGTNRLFKNEGNDNRWIQIDLEGVESNRDAVGSRVYVTTPD